MKKVLFLLFTLSSVLSFGQTTKVDFYAQVTTDTANRSAIGGGIKTIARAADDSARIIKALKDSIAAVRASGGNGGNSALGWLSIDSYGAPTDTTTDASTAIKAAVAAAVDGSVIFFPARKFLVNDSIVINKRITLMGSGRGSTIIKTTSGVINVFVLSRAYSTVRDMSIHNRSATTPTAGSAIKTMPYTDVNQPYGAIFLTFENLDVDRFYDNFYLLSSNHLTFSSNQSRRYVHYGMLLRNDVCVDCGDQSIVGCWFDNGYGYTAAAGIRWEGGGGLKISNTKFNWFESPAKNSYSIDANISNTVDFLVNNCSFENYSISAIHLVKPSGFFNNVVITGNQFAPASSTTTDIDINGINYIMIASNLFIQSKDAIHLTNGSNATIGPNLYAGSGATVTATNFTNLQQLDNNTANNNSPNPTYLNLNGGGGYNYSASSALNVTNNFNIKWSSRLNVANAAQPSAYVLGFYGENSGHNTGANDSWAIIYNFVTNKYEFFSSSYTGADPRTAFPALTDNAWHDYEVAYDGTNIVLKVDGVTQSTTAKTFSIKDYTVGTNPSFVATSAFRIGQRPGSVSWSGDIKNVVIQKAGTTMLNLPLTSNVNDISGNSLNLTMTGGYSFQ